MDTIHLTSDFLHCLSIHLIICVLLWAMMLLAIAIDLWDRIYTQRKTGKRVLSNKMRQTIDKVSEYWRFELIAFIIDAIVFVICALLNRTAVPVMSMLFTLGLLIVEFKSLYEHAKERKSHVTEMTQLVKVIVSAATDKDAKRAINEIGEYLESGKRE